MAKRRILKKKVNYIIGELFAECLIASKLNKEANNEKIDALFVRILNLQNDYICRISHTEPGNVKAFYKHLTAGFEAEANSIIDKIDQLH